MDDVALLAAIREGRPEAFDAFVERYGRRLFAFGLRMCGHQEDAEDVFQDTLLKAYEQLSELREPAALRTWLFRVASNQCLMTRRRPWPRRTIPLDDFVPSGSELDGDPEIPDWTRLPEEEAERSELHRALEEALLELPPDYRIVALLRDVEGLSTRETSEALGVGASAVKMRLHRARLALRERLVERFRRSA